MSRERRILGHGLENIVYESCHPNRVIKVQNPLWRAAQHFSGIDPDERMRQNIDLINEYFPIMSVPTAYITVNKRTYASQARLYGFTPFHGTKSDLKRYLPQLRYIAAQNMSMYEETGFTLDLMSMHFFIDARLRYALNPDYWGLPNLLKNDKKRMVTTADYGIFQVVHPKTLIDLIAYCNLVPFTLMMQQRMGLTFLPEEALKTG